MLDIINYTAETENEGFRLPTKVDLHVSVERRNGEAAIAIIKFNLARVFDTGAVYDVY